MAKPKSARDSKRQHNTYTIMEVTLQIYVPKHNEEMCENLFDLLHNKVNKFLKEYNKKYQLDNMTITHMKGYNDFSN